MRATRTPFREIAPDRYVCDVCGIQRSTYPGRDNRTCRDCQLVAKDVRFLALIADGLTVRAAAKIAGLNSAYAYRLATPDHILARREAIDA